MTNEEILTKAIRKACGNGYNYWNLIDRKYLSIRVDGVFYKKSPYNFYRSIEGIIFSHEFAKAFWDRRAEEEDSGFIMTYGIGGGGRPKDFYWQYHLQQMVLEEDPIKYLERFL